MTHFARCKHVLVYPAYTPSARRVSSPDLVYYIADNIHGHTLWSNIPSIFEICTRIEMCLTAVNTHCPRDLSPLHLLKKTWLLSWTGLLSLWWFVSQAFLAVPSETNYRVRNLLWYHSHQENSCLHIENNSKW